VAEPETDALAARYGRTRTNRSRDRWLIIGAAIAFAVVLVAWVVWAGLDGQKPTVQATDTGHRLLNDERAVEVSWTLSVPPGNPTACIVLGATPSPMSGWYGADCWFGPC